MSSSRHCWSRPSTKVRTWPRLGRRTKGGHPVGDYEKTIGDETEGHGIKAGRASEDEIDTEGNIARPARTSGDDEIDTEGQLARPGRASADQDTEGHGMRSGRFSEDEVDTGGHTIRSARASDDTAGTGPE